jgi:tetratricopeptide (TPR) repeat protein
MKLYKLAPLMGVLILVAAFTGCNKLKARNHLNMGVAAFRNAQFQVAIDHFQEAVRLDPSLLNARLYLATAYAQQYVPGGESEENTKMGQEAIKAFENVLSIDPGNTTALASIANTYYGMKDFDKAKEFQEKRIQVEPTNPEPYYWIGTIDWTLAFKNANQLRKDRNLLTPKDPKDPNSLPPLPAKDVEELIKTNGPLVDEGLKDLMKAIELKPNDFDTMSYINLMYRQKSELETDPDAREADLKTANEWTEKALNVRKGAAAQTTSTAGGQ